MKELCNILISSGVAISIVLAVVKIVFKAKVEEIVDAKLKLKNENCKIVHDDFMKAVSEIKRNYVQCLECDEKHKSVDYVVRRIDENVNKIVTLLLNRGDYR